MCREQVAGDPNPEVREPAAGFVPWSRPVWKRIVIAGALAHSGPLRCGVGCHAVGEGQIDKQAQRWVSDNVACHRGGMSADRSHARDLRARYAFGGPSAALNRTLPLVGDERVILEGTLRFYRSPVSRRLSYVRLTSDRLTLLHHYAWRPDTVTEVPPHAVRTLERDGPRLQMTWTGQDGGISFISLAPWSGHTPVRRAINNLDQLTSDLRAWLRSVG
jgi:hypothetical protein